MATSLRSILIALLVLVSTSACNKKGGFTPSPIPEPEPPLTVPFEVVAAAPTPNTGGTLTIGTQYSIYYTIKCQAAGIEWVGYYVRDDGATTTDVNKIRGTCRDGVNTQNFGFSATIVAVAPLYQFGAGHSVTLQAAVPDGNGGVTFVADKVLATWTFQ